MTDIAASSTRTIAVTGGKGGVGKTSIALNLALTLTQAGRRVLLLDADLGLGNVDVLLGLNPRYNLGHVVRAERRLEEVLLEGPGGLQILPAANGVSAMVNMSTRSREDLIDAVGELASRREFLIVDTAAGMSNDVIAFSLAAHNILLVLANEPAALTDAYGLVKVLSRDHGRRDFEIVANQVASDREGLSLYRHFSGVTDRFLDVALRYAGAIPSDPALLRAARVRRPLVEVAPTSRAVSAFDQLAAEVLSWPPPQAFEDGFLLRQAGSAGGGAG